MLFIVSPGQTIQSALDVASPGDTILVQAGIYHQRVSIPLGKDRLRIIGAGIGKTILDGFSLTGGSGITMVGTTNVTIAGFTIRNFSASGIDLFDSRNVVIRHNEIRQNAEYGIKLVGCPRALVKANAANGNGASGILIGTTCDNSCVVDNQARSNQLHGIEVHAMHVLVYRNEAHNNAENGIAVNASESWLISNKLRENKESGIETAIGVTFCFIAGNDAVENADDGLHLGTSTGGHIVFDNTFSRNGEASAAHGISISSAETLLYRNKIEENADANVNGSGSFTRSLVLANIIRRGKGEGIDPIGGDQDRILANRVEQNAGAGLAIDGSNGHIVDDNTISANGDNGIRLDSVASLNAIRSTTFKGNEPFDVLVDSPAELNNTFDLNKCDRCSPPSICG